MLESLSAAEIVARLGLSPHPEGGHYRETYRAPTADGERASCTLIYFLLTAGQVSAWHRVDATEIWLWHAGAPLLLSVAEAARPVARYRLGIDLSQGQHPQAVVPPLAWQSAHAEGAWSLVSCTVAPAFTFAGFEMAPPGWRPDGDTP